jgi:hypothetical protein
MRKWQFLVVKQFGGVHQRQQTCARIKQRVEQHGLSDILPLVKYERGRQKEYYLGIAIDRTTAGQDADAAEEIARHVLVDAGIAVAKNPQFSYLVEAEDVQRLLTGTLECDSFTLPIAYDYEEDTEAPSAERLVAEVDGTDLLGGEPSSAETQKFSRLLQWCSAAGSGELARMRQVCKGLGFSSEWGGSWSILRRFALLGHLEFAADSLRWSTIPPTLVTPVADSDCRILVGQRTPNLISFLRNTFVVDECPQIDGPSRIVVRGVSGDLSYKPGRPIMDLGCVAEHLANLLPAIDDWTLLLPTWDEQDFRRFEVERYEPQFDRFYEVSTIDARYKAGLHRFKLEQPRIVTLALFDDRAGRWICGDYYGLRFLARSRMDKCRVVFRGETGQLIIPATDRWPMPYERTLVLAGGALPLHVHTEQGDSVLVYQGVTNSLAERLASLLGLELEVS